VTQLSRRQMEARADAVKNAVAITRMEGGEPSAFCREQLDRFVAGRSRSRRCATACCDTICKKSEK
jgi:Antitoxin VbhA